MLSAADIRSTVVPGAPAGCEAALRVQPANAIRSCLREHRFCWTVEFIPSADKVLQDQLAAQQGLAQAMGRDPQLAGFSVTDRVHSDRDPDPVGAAAQLLRQSGRQPFVHFSGKDRETEDLAAAIARMRVEGLENLLVVTGDRLKEAPRGRRPRYLESVAAIQEAKRLHPELFVAAVLNPFKYREEEAMAQYLKLGKKVGAGADCIVTQIGFDMAKYEEAQYWAGVRNYRVPLIANVMPLSAPRARYIRRHRLAGVTVTDSLLALLEAEEQLLPDKGQSRVMDRLALQIVGVQLYGYAGVQLTAVGSAQALAALQDRVTRFARACPDRRSWYRAWEEALTLPDGTPADPAPADGWYLAQARSGRPRRGERWKYRLMKAVHGLAFDDGLLARMAAPLFAGIPPDGRGDTLLARLERAVKAPLVGCETCGACRLAATHYICPETCPKGLANGPCGGTRDNLCEFGDRECVHSRRYRIARDAGELEQLEQWIVPPVPRARRSTSSWPPHFRGEGPGVRVIEFRPRPAGKA